MSAPRPEGRAPTPPWLGPAAVLAGLALVVAVWWLEHPPAPVGIDAPADVFSAERAFVLLEDIAARPHMPGSAEHDRVRELLVRELEGLGLEVEVQEATVVLPRGRVVRTATVRNILARKRGTASTGGIALASHYDSQQLAPGAGDDGAGVAATLEAVRAMARSTPLRNDLYVIITDAEELGLIGARAFVDEHPWWTEIDVLLSFEARGSQGQSVMFETNVDNGWVVREFARADPHPTGSSLYYEIYQRMPNDTDFSVYKRAGVTGLNFALAEGADVYHRPTDSVDNLSLATLQHHGEHALAMGRHFGDLDLGGATTAPDAVFFRFPGLGLVTYPYGLVPVFALLVLAGVAVVLFRGARAGRLNVAGIATGAGLSVAAAAIAAAGSWVIVRLVAVVHHELGSVQGRALYNEAFYGMAVACIAVAAVAATFFLGKRWFSAADLAAGGVVLPLLIATVTSVLAPGVSMLFLWPSVFAIGAARQLSLRDDERPYEAADLAAFALLAAPVVALLFPLVWTVYMGLSIMAAPLVAITSVILLILMVPLFEIARAAISWKLPAVALGLALGLVVAGVVDARPGPARPVPEDLVYALDRETATASWATMTTEPSPWLEALVGASASDGDLAAFLGGNPRRYRTAPAPLVDASPATAARLVAPEGVGADGRTARVAITSALGPELMNVSPVAPGWRLRAVNGVPVDSETDWLLQHWGRPPEGNLILDLENTGQGAPLELVLVEFLMRLPPVPGVDVDRPPGFDAHAGRLTDVSLFRQVLRFEPRQASIAR